MGKLTFETFALKNSSIGESFWTERSNNMMTAMASQVGVKINCEKYVAIDNRTTSRLTTLTKVTIVEKKLNDDEQ